MKKERKKHNVLLNVLLLSAIVIVAVVMRWQHIGTPLADFHSWRQADTAAVARNFQRDGIDLLRPRFDDISRIQSGQDNLEGYRMVEFPLYNAGMAILASIPGISIVMAGRLITILASIIVIVILYIFALEERGVIVAASAGILYATFPFFVFFSRVVLPESTALALTFLGLFFLYLNLYKQKRWVNILFYLLAAAFFAAGILVKPTVIFYALAFGWLFLRKYEWSIPKRWQVYLFFILSLIPFLLWRQHIAKYPQGIPVSDWLFTSVNTSPGGLQTIFFKPSFFRWIFYERINNIILGGYVTVFFVLGVIRKQKNYFLLSIIVSAFVFLFVFQGGNVQHEYYQTIILPALALGVGLGISFIAEYHTAFINPFATGATIIALSAFSYFISYYQVRGYYNYPTELVNISNIIKSVTAPGDRIITDTTGDTTLLFLSDRKGSPAPILDLKYFKENENYKYFVTQDKEVIARKKKEGTLKLKFENSKFAIFEL